MAVILLFIPNLPIVAAEGTYELGYSSYLGGSEWEKAIGIAIDNQGYIYVGGETSSPEYPTTDGAYQQEINGGQDAFITKLSPDGTQIIWSTFLGGSGSESLWGLDVYDDGSIIATGYTTSDDFPLTDASFQSERLGISDIYVVKLTGDGAVVEWSTLIGGSSGEIPRKLLHDDTGIYLIGQTTSNDFPTTAGAFDESANGILSDQNTEAFVSKFSPDLANLEYSTFIGGNKIDVPEGAVIVDGGVVISGWTNSEDFPGTLGGFQPVKGIQMDCFVTSLSADGSDLLWSTFLGGSNHDSCHTIVDMGDAFAVSGWTSSILFPTSSNAYDRTPNDLIEDLFITKLSRDGSEMYESTLLGGSGADRESRMFAGPDGSLILALKSGSSDFPMVEPLDDSANGGWDLVIAQMSGDLSSLLFSTYVGGEEGDYPMQATVRDDYPVIACVGFTNSLDFPVTEGAISDSHAGGTGGDGYLSVISFEAGFTFPIHENASEQSVDPGGESSLSLLWPISGFGVLMVVLLSVLLLRRRSQ